MVLHFSVNFENDPFTYHGETEYPLNIFQNCEPYAESMTAFVKSDLVDSMRKWGYTPEDLTAVCFYFYRMAEEIVFFEWEKEDVTKLQSTTTQ